MKYCPNCGNKLVDNPDVCIKCGKMITSNNASTDSKNKIAAALLALFLGVYGAHNFYLGYTSKAVTQLVLTIVGLILCIVVIGVFMIFGVAIWAFIEFIMILTGSIKDADGNELI